MKPNYHLKHIRELRGWSQAKAAQELGTTTVTVSRWERGLAVPSPYFREQLCTLFGQNASELGFLATEQDETGHKQAVLLSTTQPEIHQFLIDPLLPVPLKSGLIGRETILTELKAQLLLDESGSRTLAISGLPGVGKTTLVATLAHDPEIHAHFPDGVLWVGLGPRPQVISSLHRWASLLSVSESEMAHLHSLEDWTIVLRTHIGQRSFLLVIDDAWLPDDALAFKVGGPRCAYLLTTRFPTIAQLVAEEQAVSLPELNLEAGLALLASFVPKLVSDESETAHALVTHAGGLPLALNLIGKYLLLQQYSGQPRRVHAAIKRMHTAAERLQLALPCAMLERSSSLPENTPLSLQSVIAVSDQRLTNSARTALYALSVFPAKPNTFSEEAALAVSAQPSEALDELVDVGLLESAAPGRYTLHQTIADYAHVHLHDITVHHRFITYTLEYIQIHKSMYDSLERENDNLLAALQGASVHGQYPELLPAVLALSPFLKTHILYEQAEMYLHYARRAALSLNDADSVTICFLYLAQLADFGARYEQAAAYANEGLHLAKQLDNQKYLNDFLKLLGITAMRQGNYPAAKQFFQEALEIAQQISQQDQTCSLLSCLGELSSYICDLTQALTYYQKALNIARQTDNDEQICTIAVNLGAITADQGNWEQAEQYLQEALSLARRCVDYDVMAASLTNLGDVARRCGHLQLAQSYYLDALHNTYKVRNRRLIAVTLTNFALLQSVQQEHAQAAQYFQESLTIAYEVGSGPIISDAFIAWGEIQLMLNHLEAASDAFRQAQKYAPAGQRELTAKIHYGLARIAAMQGKLHEARALAQKSLAVLTAIGNFKASEVQCWLDMLPSLNSTLSGEPEEPSLQA